MKTKTLARIVRWLDEQNEWTLGGFVLNAALSLAFLSAAYLVLDLLGV